MILLHLIMQGGAKLKGCVRVDGVKNVSVTRLEKGGPWSFESSWVVGGPPRLSHNRLSVRLEEMINQVSVVKKLRHSITPVQV